MGFNSGFKGLIIILIILQCTVLKKIRYKTVVYVFDFKLSWDVVPRPVDERMHLRKDGVPCTVSERAHCALHIGTFHALKEIFGYVSVICFFFFFLCALVLIFPNVSP